MTGKFKYDVLANQAIRIAESVLGRRSKVSNQDAAIQPFFVFGSGRTGSTLLASLLNNHEEVFLPSEQYALPYALMKWHLYRHLGWNSICKLVVHEFSRPINNLSWNISADLQSAILSSLESVPKEEQNFEKIVTAIFSQYGSQFQQSFSRYGDHSPVTSEFGELVAREFRDSPVIFMIRDPRDVVLSYQKLKDHNTQALPIPAAKKWLRSIETLDKLKQIIPSEKLMIMRYEDLVNEPESTMRTCIQLLGLNFNSEILNRKESPDVLNVGDLPFHSNLGSGINTSSVGRWKNGLSNEILSDILPIVEGRMVEFNY